MTSTQRRVAGTPVGEIVAVTTTTFTAQSYALNEAPPFGSLLRVAVSRGGRAGEQPERAPALPVGYDEGRQAAAAGAGGPRGYGIAAYYALCYGSQTGSIEPGRQAVAWGRFEDDEEDIYRRQPQLAQVLRTTFDALLVGYDVDTYTPDVTLYGGEAEPDDAAMRRDGVNGHAANGHAAIGVAPAVARRGAVATTGADPVRAAPAPVQRVPGTPPRLHATVRQATPDETVRFNRNLAYLRFVLRANLPLADDFIAAAIAHAYEAGGRDEAFLLDAARGVARLLGAEHERVMNILELLDS